MQITYVICLSFSPIASFSSYAADCCGWMILKRSFLAVQKKGRMGKAKMGKAKKKKPTWQHCMEVAFSMLIGAVCGVLGVKYVVPASGIGKTLPEAGMLLAGILLIMYLAVFLQIIIHEAGHLVFGLLSGYRFSSFRIMGFMWVKLDGKIRFRRFTLAGTAGQCLMSPPDFVDGKIPVALYNLGGPLMNLAAAMLSIGMSFAFAQFPSVSRGMLIFAAVGFWLAAMNGVPMHAGMVNNDGYNAYSLRHSYDAQFAFWLQMKINGQIGEGIRLKDMPDGWFAVPADGEMKNSMVAVRGVYACNRLMDARKFAEADRLMEHLLELDSGIVDLHRKLMVCDRMYVELIGENRREVLDGMRTKEQMKLMKAMKNFPSVLRTEYAYARLAERDAKKAGGILARFEKCARTYPYPSEIEAERELIGIAGQSV